MSVIKKFVTRSIILGCVALGAACRADGEAPAAAHVIAVNQIGYLTAQPKRFTAPLSGDDATFTIRARGGDAVLFRGAIRGHIGDFSAFRPADTATDYIITVEGGALAPGASYPFAIRADLWREQFWPAAVDFMVDIRSVTGTHPSAFGGGAYRDSTYYAFEAPSLIMLYQASPALIDAMPRQLDWAADKARVLAPGFVFDSKNPESDGVMYAVRRYYTGLAPPAPDAPDVVKLIHWSLGYLLMHPASRDSSDEPLTPQIHSQHVEQFAYLLAAWPQLARWLPDEFRIQCRDFAFAHWESSGLLAIDPLWDPATYEEAPQPGDELGKRTTLLPYKGRHAPGHSIVPNLLLHALALREHRADAPRYLTAAIAQTQWLIDHLDWADPRTTKGHRMSEFRTMLGLVWFLQHHPEAAPAGLREKIAAWARVAVSRSNNLRDFRRYDLISHWSLPGLNEPGNLLGFTAAALAASWVIEDPALRARLREIAFAQSDAVFGRNPLRVAGVSFPAQGFPAVERGWPIRFKLDTCARLETTRGSITASCGTEFYPYNPAGKFRHSEGWVNFNAAWNVALAYAELDRAASGVP
ncbi:MAG: hypothetical protein ACREIA_12000 [Opitutaceae bacterium]